MTFEKEKLSEGGEKCNLQKIRLTAIFDKKYQ